jgi:hypothetical protein
MIDALILENYRCFQARKVFPLRPLTFLVGENSTGKTSFLAAIRMVRELSRFRAQPDFNEQPFDLGAFDDIANFVGGTRGRASSFALGFKCPHPRGGKGGRDRFEYIATLVNRGGHPEVQRLELGYADLRVHIALEDPKDAYQVTVRDARLAEPVVHSVPVKQVEPVQTGYWPLLEIFLQRGWLPPAVRQDVLTLLVVLRDMGNPPPYALAPIRTRPERNYNLKTDFPRPEGEHVPMVLSGIRRASPSSWYTLAYRLAYYGKKARLFSSLRVQKPGRLAGDSFKVVVKLSGPERNLVDVGYGISQVLPVLVDILTAKRGQLFLLQQPEVHLHPRAQAELGSFFAQVAAQEGKRFVVETHADALIDRVRLDIRDKNSGLSPKDALVLFFERGKGDIVRVHPIEVDEQGNLIGAPASYRSFFLREEAKLLGVS